MADFPQYPATSFDQAVDLTIFTSNQLSDVINGDATSVVETESGEIPTLRKALIDNFYFKTPIAWNPGNTTTVFNQLYVYSSDDINKGWYYAPTATAVNPVLMGSTPVGDANWKLYSLSINNIPAQVYPWYTEITQATTSIVPPYEFDTAIVTYNGLTLVAEKDYTIANNTITFTPALQPEVDAEVPDILFCYIGKVQEGNPSTNYVTYNSLSAPTAAGLIGTDSGVTVQRSLDLIREDLASSNDDLGSGLVGFNYKSNYPAGSIAALVISNFQDEQPIQYYYDNNGGDWDEAIFEAQLAVYLYGFSPKLRLPHSQIKLTRSILGGVALGDYIHQRRPDLNFYDAATGNYAAVWPLHLEGTYLFASDLTTRTTLGTQITLTVENNTITTFKDMGIIHCGPTEYDQVRRTASTIKKWPGNGLVLRNINIAGATVNGSTYPWMHGVYTYGSAKNLIENVVVNNVWGSGILFDWVFDSLIKNTRFIGCGRMQTKNYFAEGHTSADYQLYAPFQTLFSPGSNVGDNTNFIRLEGVHFEDCYTAADMIIAGSASPVWLTDPHFECATIANTSAGAGTKTCVAAGGFGVRYFMEESQPGWDSSTATVRVNAGQGNVLWRGGGIYSATYEYQTQQAGFGTISLESNLFPNQSNIRIRTSSTGAGFRATNSNIGNISFSGGNSNTAPLILEGCPSVGIISMSYTHPARLSNTKATALVVTNPFVSEVVPWVLDNCTFEYINIATVANAMGKIYLTSTTVPSTFRTGLGKLILAYYAYFSVNLSSPLQSTTHQTVLTVSTTQSAAALLQEGEYNYPSGTIGDTAGLPMSGRSVLEVKNYTPDGYVTQTSTGISTGNYVKYYRIIPYTSGVYGTPSAWTPLTN